MIVHCRLGNAEPVRDLDCSQTFVPKLPNSLADPRTHERMFPYGPDGLAASEELSAPGRLTYTRRFRCGVR